MFKSLLIFTTIFSMLHASASERLLASISSISHLHEADRIISILRENVQITDQVRQKLITTHLGVFQKKNPTDVDFKTFEDDLAFFLNLEKLVIKNEVKPNVSPPDYVQAQFNKKQKKKMKKFYVDFNENIYPLLQRGIEKKKARSIVQGLKRWDKNNQDYVKFINSCIESKKAENKKVEAKNKKTKA